ncbi:MAG: flagellar motor protein MotB [Verrucomicrobiota bacterium]
MGGGGSWKVAYADFVTAMMALFLVLWLISSDDVTREQVQRYFRGEITEQGSEGIMQQSDMKPFAVRSSQQAHNDLVALQQLKRATEKLQIQFNNSAEPGDDMIRFDFLADGIRITALDRSRKPFFYPQTADLTNFGSWVLNTVAWEIERYPFKVEVEGHVQKGFDEQLEKKGQIGWDLSSARAVTAQRALEEGGVDAEQFWRVAGYSDRKPINESRPDDEENRRISIIVRPEERHITDGLE